MLAWALAAASALLTGGQRNLFLLAVSCDSTSTRNLFVELVTIALKSSLFRVESEFKYGKCYLLYMQQLLSIIKIESHRTTLNATARL